MITSISTLATISLVLQCTLAAPTVLSSESSLDVPTPASSTASASRTPSPAPSGTSSGASRAPSHAPSASPSAISISDPQFSGEESPYYVVPTGTDIPPEATSTDPSTLNKIGTFLYGYDDCTKNYGAGAKKKIDDAYYDAWVMSNTDGVHSNIDWNNAAALEFLGAPGYNKPQQSQIQAVFANVATVIYSYKNPFQHALHVRCDDPYKRCQNRPDDDPCQPKPPNPGEKPKPTPIAYAKNKDDKGYPMINFCEAFMNRRKLSDAILYGKAQPSPNNLDLAKYDNRAQTFLHELLHLDLAADSPSPNPSILDLQIDIKAGNTGNTFTFPAYGPALTKVLARYHDNADPGSTGYYVQRNSDNLAYYALAKYVTKQNDNIYPHLPIVKYEIDGPPYPGLFPVISSGPNGTNVFLNTTTNLTDTINTLDTNFDDYPGCSDDADDADDVAIITVNITNFAPDDAYPANYIQNLTSWVTALKG